jgi:hypothetical protein
MDRSYRGRRRDRGAAKSAARSMEGSTITTITGEGRSAKHFAKHPSNVYAETSRYKQRRSYKKQYNRKLGIADVIANKISELEVINKTQNLRTEDRAMLTFINKDVKLDEIQLDVINYILSPLNITLLSHIDLDVADRTELEKKLYELTDVITPSIFGELRFELYKQFLQPNDVAVIYGVESVANIDVINTYPDVYLINMRRKTTLMSDIYDVTSNESFLYLDRFEGLATNIADVIIIDIEGLGWPDLSVMLDILRDSFRMLKSNGVLYMLEPNTNDISTYLNLRQAVRNVLLRKQKMKPLPYTKHIISYKPIMLNTLMPSIGFKIDARDVIGDVRVAKYNLPITMTIK